MLAQVPMKKLHTFPVTEGCVTLHLDLLEPVPEQPMRFTEVVQTTAMVVTVLHYVDNSLIKIKTQGAYVAGSEFCFQVDNILMPHIDTWVHPRIICPVT